MQEMKCNKRIFFNCNSNNNNNRRRNKNIFLVVLTTTASLFFKLNKSSVISIILILLLSNNFTCLNVNADEIAREKLEKLFEVKEAHEKDVRCKYISIV